MLCNPDSMGVPGIRMYKKIYGSKKYIYLNIRNINDSPCVCVVSFTVCLLIEPFQSRFGELLDFELYLQYKIHV